MVHSCIVKLAASKCDQDRLLYSHNELFNEEAKLLSLFESLLVRIVGCGHEQLIDLIFAVG